MTNSSHPWRLAVVGGGVSGLAVAHRLHSLLPEAQLRLFEAGPRLGGALRTHISGDALLEFGADSFSTKLPWALELCRELGLESELISTNPQHRRAMVVCHGHLRPVPEGFVLMQPRRFGPLLRSPILSLAGKLRVLAEPWIGAPSASGAMNYDESVASFGRRRLGREAYERLAEPLMAGIYVADADRLSLAATMPEFLEAERRDGSLHRAARRAEAESNGDAASKATKAGSGARYESFMTLRRGMSSLIEAMAGALPAGSVRLSTPVAELSKGSDRRWRVVAGGGAAEEFDGVILATPPSQVASLAEKWDPQLAHVAAKIEFASSVVVLLVYSAASLPRALDSFGAVVPRIEQRPIIALSFPSVKFPGRGPADQVPIRVFLGGALRPELPALPDEKLAVIAHGEIVALLGATGAPIETHVARWPGSMPQYHVGHLEVVGAMEHMVATHPGLQLAGNAYHGVGIPQCVHTGRAAAERLAEELTRGR